MNRIHTITSSLKSYFRQNELIFAALSFFLPFLIRSIPEILMGEYIVGFDTMGFYVPSTLTLLKNGVDFWALIAASPLIHLLLLGITNLGISIIVTLKILGPFLVGILGLVAYLYAKAGLSWSTKKSLTAAVFSTLYFISLRVSWDMFRSELALIFLFPVLILLQKNLNNNKDKALISILMFLIVLSHQLVALILFVVILSTVLNAKIKREKGKISKVFLCYIPAFILLIVIISLNIFVYSSPLLGFSPRFSRGFEELITTSHIESMQDILGFTIFCYLPLLPFLIFSLKNSKKNLHLNAWILWTFVPLLLLLINPSFFLGGVLPYRWILLLTYPLSFYAVEGLFRIKWRWYETLYKIVVVTIIAILTFSFISLPNREAIGYLEAYPRYVPKSMLQNTLQLSDCQDTINVLQWAKHHLPTNGYLLVHQAFYGWGTLEFDINRLFLYSFENSSSAAKAFRNVSSNPLFLIWWINGTGWYDQRDTPSSFVLLFHSGNIAIYNYTNID